MILDFLNIVALILSFSGSIFLAFSVLKNPDGIHRFKEGKKIFLASINLIRFRIGVWLLVSGFAVQIILQVINMT